MDLIPIIEYTLLIFIGLLFLVILISFLLFVLRKNKNSENQQSSPAREYIPVDHEIKYLIPVSNEVIPERKYSHNTAADKTNTQKSSRYTILNPNPGNNIGYDPSEYRSSGYTQERVTSFEHRFAPSKSKDAFAMFK